MTWYREQSEKDAHAHIMKRLRQALASDGDFPARTQTVLKVKALVNNPNTRVDQIAEIVLTEISLGTRILHLVNSAYYQGSRKITTISQAIMRVGMQTLSEMFSGMVLMQRFVPAAKRGGAFSDTIKRSLLTSLLSAQLAEKKQANPQVREQAYLAGSLFHIGFLLLAYYFPQVYDSAEQRAVARGQNLYQSIVELLGISQLELTLAVLDSLEIPSIYSESVSEAHRCLTTGVQLGAESNLPYYLQCAALLADAICDSNSQNELDAKLVSLSASSEFPLKETREVLKDLAEHFSHHCEVIDMGFLRLPEYLYPVEQEMDTPNEQLSAEQRAFQAALNELKQAANDKEPLSSILLLALQTLVSAMGFDRAVLLLYEARQNELIGKASFGTPTPKPVREMRYSLAPSSESILAKALTSLKPERKGDPIFTDSIEQVAIPIAKGKKIIGVLYAEVVNRSEISEKIDFELGTAINSLMHQLEIALNNQL